MQRMVNQADNKLTAKNTVCGLQQSQETEHCIFSDWLQAVHISPGNHAAGPGTGLSLSSDDRPFLF